VAGGAETFEALEPRQMLSGDGLRFDLAAQAGTNSVVTADFDHNGVMDPAAANAEGGSISVILNKEDKFESTDNYPTGGTPFELGVFDFDQDAFPDLMAFDRQNSRLVVLHNRGDGSLHALAPNLDGQTLDWSNNPNADSTWVFCNLG
jgi:hypothetical protein